MVENKIAPDRGSFQRMSRGMKFLNLLIQSLILNTWESVDAWLDWWYDSLRAMRLKRAEKKALTRFYSDGKQYHVIPVKLSNMWMTEFMVVNKEDIKYNKKIGAFQRKIQVEDVLTLSVFTTPAKHTCKTCKFYQNHDRL